MDASEWIQTKAFNAGDSQIVSTLMQVQLRSSPVLENVTSTNSTSATTYYDPSNKDTGVFAGTHRWDATYVCDQMHSAGCPGGMCGLCGGYSDVSSRTYVVQVVDVTDSRLGGNV